MSPDWDEARKTEPSHRVGEDLSRLSVAELRERLDLLAREKLRIEDEMKRKDRSLAEAEGVFGARGGEA
ncbi:DUF1192 domain-containing protein [Lutibaculum baratangense]|uniref:DUF1192 domain-containing protein n=1 Tax=Lutibaculum baratangense AMV1 TaxID=631454 RepID=V4TKW1_9HYPH|nr:DUF1192 domain-containing protein [Lutibaculum baratangense]ESR26458.1 hypothetical protein N177_0958 [Lutibaculum baratangense AMV1]